MHSLQCSCNKTALLYCDYTNPCSTVHSLLYKLAVLKRFAQVLDNCSKITGDAVRLADSELSRSATAKRLMVGYFVVLVIFKNLIICM